MTDPSNAKKTMRFVALILIMAVLTTVFPAMQVSADMDYHDYTVRVALNSYYGSTTARLAQAYAKLEIVSGTGTGFKAGYYVDSRDFVDIYTLGGKTAVTVIRDKNFDYVNLRYADQGSLIGGYHLELEVSFSGQSALDAACQEVNEITKYYTFPAYTSSGYRVRIGRFTSAAAADEAKQTITSRLNATQGYATATLKRTGGGANAYSVTRNNDILFQWDGASRQLALLPYGGVVSEEIGSETETWYKTLEFNTSVRSKYYGGFDFVKNSDTSFTVVNVVNLTQYICGVTPYELNTTWPEECLKALSLCAATFGVSSRNRHSGYDVCVGQHCQVYGGTTNLTQKIKNCIKAISGMILTYEGKPIQAAYHSSSGGWTENSENVWVGVLPYLRAKPVAEFESLSVANYGLWTRTQTAEEILTKLNAQGHGFKTINNVYVSKLTEVGNVYSLTFTGTDSSDKPKSLTVSKEPMRMLLGTNTLLSHNFKVYSSSIVYVNDSDTILAGGLGSAYVINGDGETVPLPPEGRKALTADGIQEIIIADDPGAPRVFVFDGRGWGHNVGMSAHASLGMAKADWTFDQIVKYFYTGIKIEGFDE